MEREGHHSVRMPAPHQPERDFRMMLCGHCGKLVTVPAWERDITKITEWHTCPGGIGASEVNPARLDKKGEK